MKRISRILILMVFVLMASGCGTITLPSLFPTSPKNQNYSKVYKKGCTPVTDDKTGKVIGETCQSYFKIERGASEKPLGFLATLTGTLARSLAVTILGFALFFIISPVAFAQFIARKKAQIEAAKLAAKAEQLKTTLTQVVKGVEDSGGVDKHPELAASLSKTMDVNSKMVVEAIKKGADV